MVGRQAFLWAGPELAGLLGNDAIIQASPIRQYSQFFRNIHFENRETSQVNNYFKSKQPKFKIVALDFGGSNIEQERFLE